LILQYLKQPEGEKNWKITLIQPIVYLRTIASLFVFILLFIIYVIALVPDYKVIAITKFQKRQFKDSSHLVPFTNDIMLERLSNEVKGLIGSQYSVKVDDNVEEKNVFSRLIIVPGIFDNETAVETLMKFESRVEFFYQSTEEHEITSLASLWKKMNLTSIKRKKGNQFMKEQVGFMKEQVGFMKEQVGFMKTDQNEPISEVDKFFNKLKYIINIDELY
jgi:beta-xylosidase